MQQSRLLLGAYLLFIGFLVLAEVGGIIYCAVEKGAIVEGVATVFNSSTPIER
jgi:hypothetical protein